MGVNEAKNLREDPEFYDREEGSLNQSLGKQFEKILISRDNFNSRLEMTLVLTQLLP